MPLWSECCSSLSSSWTLFNLQKIPICYEYLGSVNKFDHCVFFLLLPNPFAEHQDLECKLSRCLVTDISGLSPRAFHSCLSYLKDSVSDLDFLRLLLRLCFSAPPVVYGFCRGSSCPLFAGFGPVFLWMVNFWPGQRLSVFSNIPRSQVLS